MIIGGNGSGKTTFAKTLSEKLNLPLFHIDALYWRDNWQVTPEAEFKELLLQEIKKPRWIIDGNNKSTIPLRLANCDTVIYMDFSALSCICGSIKRVLINFGTSRSDMGGYCPEWFDKKFFRFLNDVINFNRKNRKRFYEMLESTTNAEIIVLKNRTQAQNFLKSLK